MWTRILTKAALVVALLVVTPAARAATLFDMAPDDAKLVVFVRDLDSALGAIDDLRATMRAMGLGDEGFRWLAEQSRKELGIDVLDRKALTAAGLDLAKGAMFVRLPYSPVHQPVLVFGVGDEKALSEEVRDLAGRAEGAKLTVKKRKEGGATIYDYKGENEWQGFQLSVRDGFGFIGPRGEPHAFVADGAFTANPISGRFPDQGALIDAGFWFDAAGAAADTGDLELRQMAGVVGEITGRLTVTHDLVRYDARATVGGMAQPFLKHLAPRFADEARQTAALRSMARDGGAVRLLVPADGIVALLEQVGALSPELRAEAKKELGFDFKDDLLDVLMGDVTFVADGGVSSLRAELSVRDAGRAEKTVRQILDLIEREGGIQVATRAVDHGNETTFVNDGRDAWFTPRIFWGFVGGRLVVSLSAGALADAAAPGDGAAIAQATLPLARERLTTPATLLSWSVVSDSLSSLHDVMAIVRSMLSQEAAGWLDFYDVATLFLDRATESAMVLDLGADTIRLQGEVGLLALAPGAPVTEPAGAYTHALQTLYTGATRKGLRELGDLARAFPDTPYGRKADGALYASSSVLTMYAMLAPAMSGMMWVFAARSYAEPYEVKAEAVAPPPPVTTPADVCMAWARDVCYYKGADSKDCKKAEKLLAKPDKKSSRAEKQKCALELYEMRGY